MTKTQKALMDTAAPFQEQLDQFLAKGGTKEDFAITFPFATGVLYGVNMTAMRLIAN